MDQAALRSWDPIQTPFRGWELDAGKVRELSGLSPARSVLRIATEWAIIFATIFISHRIGNPLVYVLAVILIGSRQHVMVLLMHEATHWRLFNTKRLNDWVCEPLVTWPVLASLRAFRYTHLAHHKNLNLSTDPDRLKKQEDQDWQFPLPRWQLFWSVAKQFTGLGLWYVLRIIRYINSDAEASGQTPRYRLTRLIYYISALAVILYFHVFTLFLTYWLVPLFTCLIAFNKMRVLSEHPPIERETGYRVICNLRPNLLERILFVQMYCYYHIEHHNYPSVPFFNLPKLYHELRAKREYTETLRPLSYWELMRSLCY